MSLTLRNAALNLAQDRLEHFSYNSSLDIYDLQHLKDVFKIFKTYKKQENIKKLLELINTKNVEDDDIRLINSFKKLVEKHLQTYS